MEVLTSGIFLISKKHFVLFNFSFNSFLVIHNAETKLRSLFLTMSVQFHYFVLISELLCKLNLQQ